MPEAYNFLWLSESGAIAGVDSINCLEDAEALRMAHGLLDDDLQAQRFPTIRRIDVYLGTRLIRQVLRQDHSVGRAVDDGAISPRQQQTQDHAHAGGER